METNPITPDEKPNNSEFNFANSTLKTANKIADNFLQLFGINARGGKENRTPDPVAGIQYKPSPIKKQHRDLRGQSDYSPLQIVFLEGAYAGQKLDLGFNINELTSEQNAEWADQDAHKVRPGANFVGLSPRTFSVSLVYFALNDDVSHLVENAAHLHETTDGLSSPPKLYLQHGDVVAVPVVCTSFRSHYEDPLPQSRGFRRCTVDLSFKLLAGRGSPHALGRPLTGTPLLDYKQTTSRLERQKKGEQAKIELLLAPCLNKEDNAALVELIESKKTNKPEDIAKLSESAFIQGAIGGIFPREIFQDDDIKTKLKTDLAHSLARSENGIGIEWLSVAKALISGDISALPARWQEAFSQLKADYDLILKSVESQNLGQGSELFKTVKMEDGQIQMLANASAINRLTNFAVCALTLRQVGPPGGIQVTSNERKTLDAINKKLELGSSTTDEEIREMFGVQTEGQIKVLRNSAPFLSRQEFVANAGRGTIGLTSYTLWQNFETWNREQK